jgi:dTDP-4-dehydrorhamnose reductase
LRRILITGGSSYLGQHLVPAAAGHYDVHYTYLTSDPLALPGASRLDVLDRQSVLALVDRLRPEAIIHLAGSNRSPDMEAVIQDGTRHIVQAANLSRARLIHLSTDVVFDGRQGPYREGDPVNPLHDYGRAKAAAEKTVAALANHAIIRASLIYGLSTMDRSTEWIAASLRAGQPVTLFDDQWRNPVWVKTLCQACLELVEMGFVGILHVSGQQAVTRAEFGLKLLDWWGIDDRATLKIGPSDDRWPRDCRLDSSLAQKLLATRLPGLDEVLAAQRRSEA